MTLGTNFDGSGWYDDAMALRNGINDGKAWAYGKEVWCNLEGRYMHVIADLSHLTGSYTMSLC